MLTKVTQRHNKFAVRMSTFALAAMALLLTTASVSAEAPCKKVKGHYAEHTATENCNSPVGLCIAGTYGGEVRGDFFGTATSFVPTADTPTTTVVLFTSDSVIHAKMHGKSGDLMIKNAGAFQSAGDGNIVDVQYITGGTGELAGASGVIRASGTFNSATGMGESDYEGLICLP